MTTSGNNSLFDAFLSQSEGVGSATHTRAAKMTAGAATTTAGGHAQSALELTRISILGGGDDARQLAAVCLSEGREVSLFTAYASDRDALLSGIAIDGNGPVGRYHTHTLDPAPATSKTNSPAKTSAISSSIASRPPAVYITGDIDSCVHHADVIFLTGPLHKQRTYAMVLADHLHDGQILVISNSRTFSAFETEWLLRVGGCRADVTIVEMQGLPYWQHRKDNAPASLNLQPNLSCRFSCMPWQKSESVVGALVSLLLLHHTPLSAEDSPDTSRQLHNVLQHGLLDASSIIEIPAMVLGGPAIDPGGPAIPMGAVALEKNNTFFNLMGDRQLALAETLLNERKAIASSLGLQVNSTLEDSLLSVAGCPDGNGSRTVPDASNARHLLQEACSGSLVPLYELAGIAGIPCPATESLVKLCSTLLQSDQQISGRTLSSMGISRSVSPEDVFSTLASRAKQTQLFAQEAIV